MKRLLLALALIGLLGGCGKDIGKVAPSAEKQARLACVGFGGVKKLSHYNYSYKLWSYAFHDGMGFKGHESIVVLCKDGSEITRTFNYE